MARTGKILAGIVGVVVLVVVALVVALAIYDWSRLKPTITARASEALGREVAIDGPLEVDWRMPWEAGVEGVLPRPHITARELSIANPEWASKPRFATLERVAFTLLPWPLLGQRVVIPHIELGRPAVFLERQADGTNNWTFGKQDETGKPAAGKDSGWKVDIGEVAFDRGKIVVDDARREARLETTLEPLGEPIPFGKIARGEPAKREVEQDYAFAWAVEGIHRKEKVRGEGRMGGLLALNDRDRPFPIQADVTVGYTRIALVGTLTDPRDLAALDLNLRLSGRSMSELFPIIRVTLPDTPSYSTDGHLTARLREPEGAVYRYQDFTGEVGESDLRGTLEYTAGEPRPRLTGTLTSRQLRFKDLGPLVGAGEAEGGADRPDGGVLPEQAFRTQRWQVMDADVRFQGERIERGEGLPLTKVDTHIMLDNGLLRLSPLAFGMAGGRLESEIRLDGRREPLAGKLDLTARGFKLQELLPDFQAAQASLGEMNAGAELAGHGSSVGALLGSADGEARLIVDGGQVSSGLMELVGLNVGHYLMDQLFGDELVRVNCLVADFAVDEGVMRPRVFLFDTENAVVRADGTVSLASEQLDLTVRPRSKGLRLFSFRSPLYVRGTFAEPDFGVQAGPLAARGAGMTALGLAAGPLAGLLALIAPGTSEGSRCAPVLEGLRSEADGRQ